MSLEDDLKRQAMAAVTQRADQWQSELRKALTRHEEVVARSLDSLQRAASLDPGALEPALATAIASAIAGQGEAGPGPVEQVKASMAMVDRATTLTEAMAALVRESARYAERAVMFIVKGQAAVGWYGHGVSQETIDSLSMPLTDGGPLGRSFESRQPLRASMGDGSAAALPRLGGAPVTVHIVPIQLRDKVAALLYADSSAELSPTTLDALEVLCRYAARVIDVLSLQKAARPAGAPLTERAPVEGSAAPPVPGAESPTVAAPAAVAAAAVQATEVTGPMEVVPSFEETGPVLSGTDQQAHEQARRFARLVVSEIKLYNEAKVAEGLLHRDLYTRLKEDIERGKQVYAERVSSSVRENTDYFYDELVRVLAAGDPAALGPM